MFKVMFEVPNGYWAFTIIFALLSAPLVWTARRYFNSQIGFGFVEFDRNCNGSGIIIKKLLPNGPAVQAGLAVGDLLITFGGTPMDFENRESMDAFWKSVRAKLKNNERVTCRVKRGDSEETLVVEATILFLYLNGGRDARSI